MRRICQSAAVLAAALMQCASALPVMHRFRFLYDGKPIQHNVAVDDNAYYFDQRLDHFDRQNLATFRHRYFVNDTYWSGAEAGGPVFLCVGGEGTPLSWMVLVSSVHCNDMVELAPQVGALLLAIEHRYYGPSNPFDDWATENLRWLSTEQALEDIAAFHGYISEQFGLTSANKWVAFGGSYPGMLSAFTRLKYPHLFHAAVSSSAPTRAKTEMIEYNNVVAQSMAATIVGGSQECLDAISSGHVTIGEMMQTAAGITQLGQLFNLCTPTALRDERNQEVFAGNGVVYLPVQSNDPSCTTEYCNIEQICELMTDESVGTPVERLAVLSKAQSGNHCVATNYELAINFYKAPNNPERAWFYQTCTEWGYYQTCDVGTECPYTQGLHTLDTDYYLCEAAFGITPDIINENVNLSNLVYGADNLQGSRILSVNGQIDPWHALAVLEAPNGDEPALWVEGASHHFWTHTSEPTDSSQVVAARQAIWMQVKAWLQMTP